MKRLIILSVLAIAFKTSGAQDSLPDLKFILGIGEHETFITNKAFDAWTTANFGRTVHPSANISGQISFAVTHYDGGVYVTATYPFQNLGLYFGRRLTSYQSNFSSFLNFEIGGLGAYYKNINPVNYTPTPDQQGQDLQLHYDSYYIGISSLNYLGALHFHFSKKMNGRLSLYPAFHIGARYGFGGGWSYGYNQPDAEDDGTGFKSVKIPNIPNLGNFNVDAGFFIGIGS